MSEFRIRKGYEEIYEAACKLNENLEEEIRQAFADKKARIDGIMKSCLEDEPIEEVVDLDEPEVEITSIEEEV